MTRARHIADAEAFLASAERRGGAWSLGDILTAAQVHATLALAAHDVAPAMKPHPCNCGHQPDDHYDNGQCMFPRCDCTSGPGARR